MEDNLMPGSGWILAQQERAADAYDAALELAYDALAREAPDGVGWDVALDDQDADGRFIFIFRDAGGYEYQTTTDPWGDQDYEPNW
jgi:hypothetical protein